MTRGHTQTTVRTPWGDTRSMRSLLILATCVLTPVACRSAPASAPPREANAAREDGFTLRSADGRSELTFGGLFQTTAGAFGSDRVPVVDFALRRMRPEITGRFGNGLRFTLETNFTDDGVELEEAWVGAEFQGGESVLRLGRMKVPFNLEEVRSRRHIDFTHFSIVNQFAPAEDHGVFWSKERGEGRIEYGLAAYNGTGASDTTSSKDVAARVMVHPFVHRADSPLRNLQLGVATTVGQQSEDVGDDVIENELGLAVVRFDPDLRLDGTRTRVGLELAWFHGPTFVQSEVIVVSQEMEHTTGGGRIGFRGAYLTVSHALTGETKTFDGVTPARPGSGAWVLAARVSELRLDDDLMSLGFVVPGTFTDRIRTLSLGLNWIPNGHVITRAAIVHSDYSEEVTLDAGRDDSELGLLVEAQLHF